MKPKMTEEYSFVKLVGIQIKKRVDEISCRYGVPVDQIEETIKQAVIGQKEQIIKEVEGLKMKKQIELPDTLHRNIGYNQALEDVLKILKTK